MLPKALRLTALGCVCLAMIMVITAIQLVIPVVRQSLTAILLLEALAVAFMGFCIGAVYYFWTE